MCVWGGGKRCESVCVCVCVCALTCAQMLLRMVGHGGHANAVK